VATLNGTSRLRAVERFAARPATAAVKTSERFGSWTLTRRIPGNGRLALFRARAAGELGPGCYLLKRPRRQGDSVAEQLLAREATVSRNATNPHLGCVLAQAARETRPFNVLPFLDGLTLGHFMAAQQGAPIAIPQALAIGRQIASALGALHAAGWLHGRLEPEHVFISPHRQVTVIGLTAARWLESSECDEKSWSRAMLPYLAPEAFSTRARLTAALDVYALGALLYEFITGRTLFHAASEREMIHAQVRERPLDVRCLRSEASPEISELLSRMLAKEPIRRPLATEVVRWLAELEIEELT
jgi:eukaryotic-like serine/threonine-protein kinase